MLVRLLLEHLNGRGGFITSKFVLYVSSFPVGARVVVLKV